MESRKLNEEKPKSTCEVKRAFVLMMFNDNYQYFKGYYRADADRENIRMLCEDAQFTINDTKGLKTDNLTADEMEDLLKNIARTDFNPYDAFICFIVSYGDSQGVLGVDGNSLSVREIIRPIIGCSSLASKPKVFFIHTCKECNTDKDPPISIPIGRDILFAFSGVDTHEFGANHKSLYISTLTEVLKEYGHDMNLTDMLTVVNRMVTRFYQIMPDFDGKQTPIFMSTLRQAVRFRNFKPEETPNKNGKISQEKCKAPTDWNQIFLADIY